MHLQGGKQAYRASKESDQSLRHFPIQGVINIKPTIKKGQRYGNLEDRNRVLNRTEIERARSR